jgi:hypothetical protein
VKNTVERCDVFLVVVPQIIRFSFSCGTVALHGLFIKKISWQTIGLRISLDHKFAELLPRIRRTKLKIALSQTIFKQQKNRVNNLKKQLKDKFYTNIKEKFERT